MPSLRDWRNMFTKVYVKYASTRQPALYSLDECVKAKPIRNLMLSSVALGTAKIVGLEMFEILQLSYFVFVSYGSLDIYLEPLASFKLFNGFNLHLEEESPVSLPLTIFNVKLYS